MKTHSLTSILLLLNIFFSVEYVSAELWKITNLTLSGNPQFNILQSNDIRFDFTIDQGSHGLFRCVKDFINFSWLEYDNSSSLTQPWWECQTDTNQAAASLRWRARNFTHSNGQPKAFLMDIGRVSNNIQTYVCNR